MRPSVFSAMCPAEPRGCLPAPLEAVLQDMLRFRRSQQRLRHHKWLLRFADDVAGGFGEAAAAGDPTRRLFGFGIPTESLRSLGKHPSNSLDRHVKHRRMQLQDPTARQHFLGSSSIFKGFSERSCPPRRSKSETVCLGILQCPSSGLLLQRDLYAMNFGLQQPSNQYSKGLHAPCFSLATSKMRLP